ncbi:MAG: class I SAM-dependent methyltransferase [bacterium]
MACLACESSKQKVVFVEFGVNIYKCQNCGHMFSSYGADQYYDGYFKNMAVSNNFWWDEAHKIIYNDFCKKYLVGNGGKLLDVGCGLGFFVKKVNNYKDWQATGYEISKTAVDFATNELKLTNILCGKVEEADFPKNYFDIITLWDVIEHIPDPDKILNYISSILKQGGFLFIHTPNANIQLFKARFKKLLYGMKPEKHYLEANDHINIYTAKSISMVLKRHNFKFIDFVHLHPIQSVSGSKNRLNIAIKNLWFNFSRIFYQLSFKKINLNNLYIVAKKLNQ